MSRLVLQLHSPAIRGLFFWVGAISTIAYRTIIVFTEFNPTALRIAWYVGTIGFIIYFLHRYEIAERRTRVIETLKLDDKIPQIKGLSKGEREGLQYLFATLKSSKEKWNYYIIFSTSILALAVGVWQDVYGK